MAADAVVICAGVASRRFAAMLGDRINLYPVKGCSITLHLDDAESRAATPWVRVLNDATKIVTSRLGADRFRVAGRPSSPARTATSAWIASARCCARRRRCSPASSTARSVPWAGLRPMTPSMMPRVGVGSRPGIFYNTGHGHLGWTLSAATAEMVADAAPGGSAPALRTAARPPPRSLSRRNARMSDPVLATIGAIEPTLVAVRRDLHAHPETGFEEHRTAGIVAGKLREWGLEVEVGIGRTGVVGTLRGARQGQRVIGLRADMDTLNIFDVLVNDAPARSARSPPPGPSWAMLPSIPHPPGFRAPRTSPSC